MKHHPLSLNQDDVKAVQKDRKTQIRTLMKDQPIGNGFRYYKGSQIGVNCPEFVELFAPWQVGDRLYVQESYQIGRINPTRNRTVYVQYKINEPSVSVELTEKEMILWNNRKRPYMKTSGRFMYKSLARIWLEITAIRVELHDGTWYWIREFKRIEK